MFGILSVEEARKKAFAMLAELQSGTDPVAAEEQDKIQKLTMADLIKRFVEEHVDVHLKPKTAWGYKRNIERNILPALGKIVISDITKADIGAFHHKMRYAPYEANRCLAILSAMFNKAELWGLRADNSNPCKHIKKYKEQKRERFLTPRETRRLGQVLRQMEEERVEQLPAIFCIKLLLLTGCRLSEIQTLKWDYIKWHVSEIHLPDSKTGAKTVFASEPAMELLRYIKHHENRPIGNPYVMYSIKQENAHIYNMHKPWGRIRKRALLPDLRIHDLRHSFASIAASQGMSLQMIGKLLGHTNTQTTARYAHLMSDPIKEAASKIGNAIGGGMF